MPGLRALAGSVEATVLMRQLEYWFGRYPEGFYKFLEPSPRQQDYREGDSWTEELNFSAEEVETAFRRIGVRHKSKRKFDAAGERRFWSVGKGEPVEKFYCCVYDRQTHLTTYFRNDALVERALARLAPAQKPAKSVSRKPAKLVSVNRAGRILETGLAGLQKPAKPDSSYKEAETTAETTTDLLFAEAAAPPPRTLQQQQPTLKKPKGQTRHQILSSQEPPYRQMTDFWSEQKRLEDPHYEFIPDDGVHLAEVWKRANRDLLRVKGAIVAFMADKGEYCEGHPAKLFRHQIEKWLARAVNGGSSNRHGQQRTKIDRERASGHWEGGVPAWTPAPRSAAAGG